MTLKIKQRIDQIRHGEVPDGYKKTKFGIIPNEWEIHTLSKHLVESRIPGTNGAIAKKLTVKLWNKGVFEKCEIHEGSENTTYYKRKKGQLIYSKLDFLNCAFGIIPEYLDGYESTQDLPCFDIENVNSYYLLAYITQRNFYIRFGMIADGGRKARRVGPEDMLSFPLIFPPLAEQEKIAEILQTQDKLIELQQKKIDELKRLKKVYLSKMFPKNGYNVPEIRFSGFTDPWEQRKLADVCGTFEYGLNAAAKEYDGKNKYIRITDIDDESRVFSTSDLTSPDICLDGMSKYLLSNGDIVFVRTGASVGKTYIFKEKDGIVYFAGFLIRATVTTGNDPEFVFQNTLTTSYEKFIRITSQRSGQPGVNAQEYGEYEFFAPSKEEQVRIGNYLRGLDDLITLHQRKLEEEQKKKKALMQLLLTGIVRVNL